MIKLKTVFKSRTKSNTRLHKTLRQTQVKTPIIKLGFFSTATYANNPRKKRPNQKVFPSVPYVARILDKGTTQGNRFIPPRPFLSNLHHRKSQEWRAYFDQVLHEEYSTSHDIAKATQATFNAFAFKIRKDLKDTIRDIKTPPNAPSTIRGKYGKKSSNPLIDTGFLRNSATFKIYR